MQPNMPTLSAHKSRGTLIALILVSMLLVGSLVFGFWAYTSRQDYKQNVDQKIADASEIVKQQTSTQKDTEFTKKEKSPVKEYKGPATYGSVVIQYPKTWSAYVSESGTGNTPLDGYFHPNFVPGIQSDTAFALRVTVVNQPYDTVLKQFDGKVKSGKIKVSAYRAPQVKDVLGSTVVGEINTGQKDTMIMLPVRDKTLQISTESEQFVKDLNEIILASLTFSP